MSRIQRTGYRQGDDKLRDVSRIPREELQPLVFVVQTTPKNPDDNGLRVFGDPGSATRFRDAVLAAGGVAVLSREPVYDDRGATELIDEIGGP